MNLLCILNAVCNIVASSCVKTLAHAPRTTLLQFKSTQYVNTICHQERKKYFNGITFSKYSIADYILLPHNSAECRLDQLKQHQIATVSRTVGLPITLEWG